MQQFDCGVTRVDENAITVVKQRTENFSKINRCVIKFHLTDSKNAQ